MTGTFAGGKTMVQEYITQIDHITDFALSADIAGRQEWGSLPGPLRQALIREGEKRLGYTYPILTASDYMEFSEMGNRSRYEAAMFDRRRALNALVLAECTENSGRFLKDIINGIYCILEESTWCVPAHNTYIRDTPQEPLADYTWAWKLIVKKLSLNRDMRSGPCRANTTTFLHSAVFSNRQAEDSALPMCHAQWTEKERSFIWKSPAPTGSGVLIQGLSGRRTGR